MTVTVFVIAISVVKEIKELRADDGAQVRGVTSFLDELYILYGRRTDQIDVYSNTDFTFSYHISVPGLSAKGIEDFTSCNVLQMFCFRICRFLFIADSDNRCLHTVTGGITSINCWSAIKWSLPDKPYGIAAILGVGIGLRVLVACYSEGSLKQKLIVLDEDGKRIREINVVLPFINSFSHVRLRVATGKFVVCYRRCCCARGETIALVDCSGKVTHSYGDDGSWWLPFVGSKTPVLREPCDLAVDDDGFVFVADNDQHRVLLLDPTLQFVRFIATRSRPRWLHFDETYRRLLVGHDSNTVTILQIPSRQHSYYYGLFTFYEFDGH